MRIIAMIWPLHPDEITICFVEGGVNTTKAIYKLETLRVWARLAGVNEEDTWGLARWCLNTWTKQHGWVPVFPVPYYQGDTHGGIYQRPPVVGVGSLEVEKQYIKEKHDEQNICSLQA
jgi:hypothetical protein